MTVAQGFCRRGPPRATLAISTRGNSIGPSRSRAEVPLTAADLLARRMCRLPTSCAAWRTLVRTSARCRGHEGRVSVRGPQHGWQVEGVEFSASVPNLFDVPIRYGRVFWIWTLRRQRRLRYDVGGA